MQNWASAPASPPPLVQTLPSPDLVNAAADANLAPDLVNVVAELRNEVANLTARLQQWDLWWEQQDSWDSWQQQQSDSEWEQWDMFQ